MPIPLVLFAMTAPLAAASPQAPPATAAPRHFDRPFISPMGEPFRPGASGDTLADWFHQADRNRDDVLTADEMEADAARFFATLDVNHDGEIDPDEIDRYENAVAPEVETSPGARIAQARIENRQSGGTSGGHGHGGGRHHSGGSYGGGDSGEASDVLDDPIGGGRFGLLNIPEPVASADADFNRGVSLEEFKRAAVQRFQLLDTSHAGRLTLGALEAQRATTIAASRRRHGSSAQPSEEDSSSEMPPF